MTVSAAAAISTTPAFCANCTRERSDLVPEPTGRMGVRVYLCSECRSVHPRQQFHDRVYDDRPERTANSRRRGKAPKSPAGWRKPSAYSGGHGFFEGVIPTASEILPNAKRYRIKAQSPDGHWRTNEEILAIAQAQPWFANAEYVSRDARAFLWQEKRR